MRITVQNNDKEISRHLADKLKQLLSNEPFVLTETQPDLVITIGGDGTMLSAFHRQAHRLDQVRFLGIHTGHLGFYTDWREYHLEELVDCLKNDQGEYVSYPLLDVEVLYQDGEPSHHFLALNESTVKIVSGTLVCDVFIDEHLLERFRGDGICVATPTGSTGYNKSLGGAVLSPKLEVLQLTEIASINNRVFRTLSSPLVTSKDEQITICPKNDDNLVLAVDHVVLTEESVREVRFKLARERIRFADYRHLNFWERVSDAFIGEVTP